MRENDKNSIVPNPYRLQFFSEFIRGNQVEKYMSPQCVTRWYPTGGEGGGGGYRCSLYIRFWSGPTFPNFVQSVQICYIWGERGGGGLFLTFSNLSKSGIFEFGGGGWGEGNFLNFFQSVQICYFWIFGGGGTFPNFFPICPNMLFLNLWGVFFPTLSNLSKSAIFEFFCVWGGTLTTEL